ncbi:MAG: hypothetical protein JXB88_10245 [Spirochaetales bacterium]|nr:hypothetical protein [Spirochaetales bacterium]
MNTRGFFSGSACFVPLHKEYECWIFKIVNKGTEVRKLVRFIYSEYASHRNIAADTFYLQYLIKTTIVVQLVGQCLTFVEPPLLLLIRWYSRYRVIK